MVYRPKQTNKNSEANINHVLDITLFHRSFYWSYISRPNPLLNFLFIHFHIPLQIPNRKGSIYFGINDRKSNQFHCHISDFKILIVDELQYNDTLPRVLLMNFIPSFKMSDNMYFVISAVYCLSRIPRISPISNVSLVYIPFLVPNFPQYTLELPFDLCVQ